YLEHLRYPCDDGSKGIFGREDVGPQQDGSYIVVARDDPGLEPLAEESRLLASGLCIERIGIVQLWAFKRIIRLPEVCTIDSCRLCVIRFKHRWFSLSTVRLLQA